MEIGIGVIQPGTPGAIGSWKWQAAESPLEPLEGASPRRRPDFKLLASRTAKKYTSVALSRQVYGNLLQKPQETDTPSHPLLVQSLILD